MLKLWNLVLTALLLFAGYAAWLAYAYDGYCYGFSDGKVPCSLSEHFAQNHGWFPLLIVVYLPHILIVGGLVYFVNHTIHQAFVRRCTRRWLE